MRDDKVFIELWYQGLGELYRASRSASGGRIGTHDSPEQRLIYYVIVALIMLFVLFSSAYLGYCFKMVSFPFVLLLFVIMILVGYMVVYLFYASYRLYKAMRTSSDPDLEDPIRIKVIRKAVKWGEKKGYICRDYNGKWYLQNRGAH